MTEKASPEIRKVPRPADVQTKSQGQSAQAVKKTTTPINKVAPGASSNTAKPNQGTNETKPTV